MTGSAKLAIVAACAGDPARASMLQLLMDGRAFTAGELSSAAGVTAQTASGHLSRMVDAGLLTVASQGRHRYYRLSSPLVAQMLEGMMVVAASNAVMTGPGNEAMRKARSCYDHLAGKLGVGIAQRLVDAGHVTLTDQGGEVTSSGTMFFQAHRHRRRNHAVASRILPSLSRLERAALSSRRRARRPHHAFLLRRGLDQAEAEEPRGRDHAARRAQIPRAYSGCGSMI